MNTRNKIMFGIGSPILMLIVLGVIVLSGISSMVKTDESVAHTHDVLAQSSEIIKSMVDMETGMRGYLLSGSEVFLEPYEDGERNVLRGITLLQELVSDNPPQVELLENAWIIIRKWETEVAIPNIRLREEIGISKTMDDVATVVVEGSGKQYFDEVRVLMDSFEAEENRLMDLRVQAKEDTISALYKTIWIVFAAAIFIGMLLAYLISRNIADPLVTATQVMRRFTGGDSKARINVKGRKDEVGVLGETFNRMAQELSVKELQLLDEILERKEAEVVANQASKAKSSFLSAMSHEIRTPLNGVLGMAQLLLKTKLNAYQKENIETILSSGQSLRSILNDILDMGKIESGNIELEELVFDVKDMVISLSKTYEFLSKEAELEFELNIDMGDNSIIRGDQNRVQQILRNLLSNAFKFTKEGKVSLNIKLLKDNDLDVIAGAGLTLSIEVCDTGKGISADRLGTIFNSFEQEDVSITREYGGSGLGLSIVKQFCSIMGGSISVSSTLNRGSVFKVFLPFSYATIEDIAQLNHDKTDVDDIVMEPRKILVAEDNEVNAIIIRGFLEGMGHSVTVVVNGELAVDAIKRGDEFDIILMDVHMPVMDGIEATLQIRKLPFGKNIPILAVTAEALRERIKLFLNAGMDAALTKPFTEQQLKRTLIEILVTDEISNSVNGENEKSNTQSLEDITIGDEDQMLRFISKVPKEKSEKLLTSAQSNLRKKMDDLRSGVESSDAEAIKLAAHTILGSSGSLYAMRISEIARIIQIDYQDLEKVRSLMPLMNETAEETIDWWSSL